MKVVCEGCSTRYSIEDDKVAGKAFKMRCRKCARVLVLRGEAPAPASAWHAVRGGRQIGPFDSGELLRRRAAGELDDSSYVWREGFADWQPLGSVSELRAPAHAAPVTTVVDPTPMPMSAAVAPPSPMSAVVAAAASSAAVVTPGGAPAARGAEAGRLHGARGETSALFSMSGLAKQALPAAPPRSGAPGGEGSGLLDIRSLARSYAGAGAAAGGDAPARTGAGSSVDLPVFPPSSLLAQSVLVPVPPAPRRDRRLMVGLVAAFGLIAICATLMVAIVLSRGGQAEIAAAPAPAAGPRVARIEAPAGPRAASPVVVEAPAAPAAPAPLTPAPESAPAPAAAPGTPAAAPGTPAAMPGAPVAVPSVRTPPPSSRTPAAPRTPSAPARVPAAPVRASTAAASTPAAAPAAAQCDQVTCVVNGYDSECCRALRGGGGGLGTPDPAPARSTLPDSLDRGAITEGLGTISTRRCATASAASGFVKAKLKISETGAVTSVSIESSPDPALSACVTEQAQRGRFKPTQRGGSFSYVWRF